MYFTVESQPSDKGGILALVMSMHISMKNSNLTIGCSKKTFDYITDFYKVDVNLKHFEIADENISPVDLFNNMKQVISDVHKENDKAVYIAPIVYTINNLSKVVDKVSNEGMVVIERDCDILSEAGNYPLVLVVFNNDKKTNDAMDAYIQNNMKLCADTKEKLNEIGKPTSSMSSEENDKIGKMRSELFKPISLMAQNFILEMKKHDNLVTFIKDGIFMDMFNFFAGKNPWQLNEIGVDGDGDVKICRKNSAIYLVAPSPDPRTLPNSIIRQAVGLLENIDNIVAVNDLRYTYIQNLHFKLTANRIVIFGPKKDLLGDWSRKNVPDFDIYMAQLVSRSNYINYKRYASDDYYRTGHIGLYDYHNNSLIRGDMLQGSLKKIALFNYNSKVLDELKGNYYYVGLYTPYILILENYALDNEKEKETYHFTDIEVYSSEENYMKYLDDLSKYKYSFITDETSKCHIVDCLKLGVVPVIDENCQVLEIEDIISDDDEWEDKSKKCQKYFEENLTVENISNRFCKMLFDYIPPGPEKH